MDGGMWATPASSYWRQSGSPSKRVRAAMKVDPRSPWATTWITLEPSPAGLALQGTGIIPKSGGTSSSCGQIRPIFAIRWPSYTRSPPLTFSPSDRNAIWRAPVCE